MLNAVQKQSPENRTPIGVKDIFFAFTQIGLTSFGGGMSGRMMRLFVYERRWMDEESFLNGLALSQALPGVNVSNMAIWIGYQLGGSRGALADIMGILFLPALLIVLLGVSFARLTQFPVTHIALAGAAAAQVHDLRGRRIKRASKAGQAAGNTCRQAVTATLENSPARA